MKINDTIDVKIPYTFELKYDIQNLEIDKKEILSLSELGPSYINHHGNYYIPITHKGEIIFLI